MNDPQIIKILLDSCNFDQTTKLGDHILEVKCLVALLWLRHNNPNSNEVCIWTLVILDACISDDLSLTSLKWLREQSQLLDVFHVVKQLKEAQKLTLNISEPLLVRLDISAENIDLNEMVEVVKELESLEQHTPFLPLRYCHRIYCGFIDLFLFFIDLCHNILW